MTVSDRYLQREEAQLTERMTANTAGMDATLKLPCGFGSNTQFLLLKSLQPGDALKSQRSSLLHNQEELRTGE